VGVVRGDGDVGVVVAHGYGGSLCDELPLVDDLAARGYTTLAYDARGFGSSPFAIGEGRESSFSADVEGAVEALRDRGIRRIALVGDSFGGTTVVAAAPLLEPRPAAVVSVGGPPSLAADFGPDLDAVGRARRLSAPFLYLVSEHDPYVALPEARKLIASAPSKDKRLLVYPGAYHAIGGLFVEAPYRDRPYRAFIAFLASRTAARSAQ
jgi:alpha-beta hydrolase superfamily lysophospholipase